MDFSDPRFWLDLAQWAGIMVLAALSWLREPGQQATAAVKRLAQEHDAERQEIKLRLQQLEERISHMPTDEELAELKGDVSAIKARLEGFSDLLRRVEHQGNLIHEHLLRQAQR